MTCLTAVRPAPLLMAMGLRGGGIRKLFLTEGAMIGLLGGALGTAVGLVLIGYFASTGIDFGAMYGDQDFGYPVKELVYPAMRQDSQHNRQTFFIATPAAGKDNPAA